MTVYRPTTSTAVGTALTNPAYAYDNNSSTAATGSATGQSSKGSFYSGFASVSNPSSVTLSVDWSATSEFVEAPDGSTTFSFAHVQYSPDGSTWTTLAFYESGAVRARGTTQYLLSGVTQLSNLKVRFQAFGAKLDYYDPEAGRVFTLNGTASISVYEVSVDVVSHGVNLSHTAPGTGTGKKVYASNLWNASAGTYGTPSTSTPAIFTQDGSNGFWFLDSYF
jgi:hypothetical protein